MFFFPCLSATSEFTNKQTKKQLYLTSPKKIDTKKINAKLQMQREDAFIHAEIIVLELLSRIVVDIQRAHKLLRCPVFRSKL